MFINRISNTKYDTANSCLFKFYNRYYRRFKGILRNEDALNFGSYIHKIFEEGQELEREEDLLKLAEALKPQFKIPATEKTRTRKCIQNFLKLERRITGETIGKELEFSIEIAEGIEFTGIIDRVIQAPNGNIFVLDYKTSKKEKNKVALFQDSQLQGYAYAAMQLFKVPISKVKCGHFYPVTNNLVDVSFTNSMINQWKKKFVEKVWDIRKRKKTQFPPMKNTFCNWCEFQHICPEFNDMNTVKQNILIEEAKLKESQPSNKTG